LESRGNDSIHHSDHDDLLRLALTKLVEIVGEAAKNVSRTLAPRCRLCRGGPVRMRNRLVHTTST
jgi:hypothetical protein